MKHISAILLLAGAALTAGAQTITNSGFTWSPSTLTVTAGTPITITITSNHDMRQVSEATWNANGNTGIGGFEFTAGTHILTLDVPGTYWYVCVPHVAEHGMKGIIIVETNTGVNENTNSAFNIFPNPASNEITVNFPATTGTVALIDAAGREVLRRSVTSGDHIGIGDLAAGNYDAELIDAQGTIQQRQRITIVH